MSFGNPFKNDDFEDLRRKEAYERQKDLETTKAVGNFFYLYIVYSFIWLVSTVFIALVLMNLFAIHDGLSTLIGMILSFFVFKIRYVKQNPFKSLIVICFIFGLFMVASS